MGPSRFRQESFTGIKDQKVKLLRRASQIPPRCHFLNSQGLEKMQLIVIIACL